MKKQIFMFRSKPHNIERFPAFRKDNFISIGWCDTGDLKEATLDEIRERLKKAYKYEGQSLSTNLGLVNSFINVMNAGDIVLIRKEDTVYIGEVGQYKWEEKYLKDYMPHTRPITWINEIPFEKFNAKIQSLLKNIRTIGRFSGTWEEAEIEQFITGEEPKTTKIDDIDDLLKESLETLKYLMKNSEDETVRLEATKEILKLINK
ncbi:MULTISPECIES: hypothetical protein [Bacillus cereus group]|uniref:hypothetical protein n=1 Tax=Bacillus cereus group TaxID=86661 RepID=UPI0011A86DD5|nr:MULTISPECIES: hypothetical protein [Bacillus cereus group]MEA1012652.1 hypothetical protein [Bacillus cereus]